MKSSQCPFANFEEQFTTELPACKLAKTFPNATELIHADEEKPDFSRSIPADVTAERGAENVCTPRLTMRSFPPSGE